MTAEAISKLTSGDSPILVERCPGWRGVSVFWATVVSSSVRYILFLTHSLLPSLQLVVFNGRTSTSLAVPCRQLQKRDGKKGSSTTRGVGMNVEICMGSGSCITSERVGDPDSHGRLGSDCQRTGRMLGYGDHEGCQSSWGAWPVTIPA